MKKFYMSLVAMFFATTMFAQAPEGKTHYFYKIESSDHLESKVYFYDETYKAIAFENMDGINGVQLRDTLTYDEQGNCIRTATYQLMDQGWIWAHYCDYTYNENGQRLTRKNYNSYGGTEFTLGGTYTYFYDENGNNYYWELEFGGGLFQKCNRTFDANGNCLEEIGEQSGWDGWEPSWKTNWTYNSNNQMTSATYYYWMGTYWYNDQREVMTYDASGNCVNYKRYAGSNVTEEQKFTFDTEINFEETIFPANPEDKWPTFYASTNVPTKAEVWGADESWQLLYIYDNNYYYEALPTTSVEESNSTAQVYPNPVKNILNIESSEHNFVNIYNSLGSLVYSAAIENNLSIDFSNYAKGIYFVNLQGNNSITKKIVVE